MVICNPKEPGRVQARLRESRGRRPSLPTKPREWQGCPFHRGSDHATALDSPMAGNAADRTDLSEPFPSSVDLCPREQWPLKRPALGRSGDARPRAVCPFSHTPFHAQPERERRLIPPTALWQTGASEQKFPVLVQQGRGRDSACS